MLITIGISDVSRTRAHGADRRIDGAIGARVTGRHERVTRLLEVSVRDVSGTQDEHPHMVHLRVLYCHQNNALTYDIMVVIKHGVQVMGTVFYVQDRLFRVGVIQFNGHCIVSCSRRKVCHK
jgi:hypothetical protein